MVNLGEVRNVLNFKLYVDSELEDWRARTATTKEPETLAWISDMQEPAVFWDVGANIGLYSLYAATLHPLMEVYAFEPEIGNFVRLCQNVALNGLRNVYPMNIALSWASSVETFFIGDTRTGNSGGQIGAAVLDGVPFKVKKVQPVVTLSGAHLVNMGLQHCQYLKIDVDGNERKIVSGLGSFHLIRQLKSMLIELNGSPQDNAEFKENLMHFTTDNIYNQHEQHSRIRRAAEGVTAENVVFVRR